MQIARTLALAAVPVLYAAPAGAQFVFEPPTYAAAGGQSHDPSLDAGDLDGDGAPDLVLSLESDEDGYRVLLNDGAGAFQAASTVATPDALLMLRLADVDEDGALDLLSTGLDGIQMRLGQGDGSFGSAALIFAPAPGHAEYLALAELTADRHLDLIVLGDGNVTLLPGHGDGSFGPAQQIASLAQHAYAVRTGDLDNDGVTDLLVVAATKVFPQILISVAWSFLGTAGGSFAAGVPHFLADQADTELLDVSGDGVPDLVFASSLGVGTRSGLGNGSFGPTKVVQAGLFATGLAAADFDGDGRTDLASVSGTSREMVLWRATGLGAFAEALRVSAADDLQVIGAAPLAVRPLLPIDADGDGRPDLVRTSVYGSGGASVAVFRNHTYGAGEPFVDLGHALSDPATPFSDLLLDTPILLLDGTLQAGTDLRVRLYRHGVEVQSAWLVFGLDSIDAPFLGGTMVPRPDLLIGPFSIGFVPDHIDLSAATPAGLPPGFSFWLQGWFVPVFPFHEPSASSAVRATAP